MKNSVPNKFTDYRKDFIKGLSCQLCGSATLQNGCVLKDPAPTFTIQNQEVNPSVQCLKFFSSPDDEFSSPYDEFSSPDDKFSSPDDEFSSPGDEFSSSDDEFFSPDDEFSSPDDEFS